MPCIKTGHQNNCSVVPDGLVHTFITLYQSFHQTCPNKMLLKNNQITSLPQLADPHIQIYQKQCFDMQKVPWYSSRIDPSIHTYY
jgi:hypothetical protein